MHGKELALNEVRLRRQAQADRHVGLAHGEVEFLVGGDQRDANIGKQIHEFAQARRQPMVADALRGRHFELAMRPLAAVGELGARGLEFQEHLVRGAVEQFALFGEDQAPRVAMKQRDAELLLERADLPRHRRLRQPKLLARVREAAGVGGRMKNLQLIPIHPQTFFPPFKGEGNNTYSAACRCWA